MSLTWCRSIAPLDNYPINDQTSLLYRYNQNAGIYRCPADHSTVKDARSGRNRSYNMSNSINCQQADHYRKYTEVPRPTQLFVFIDTHENAIWDATFGVLAAGKLLAGLLARCSRGSASARRKHLLRGWTRRALEVACAKRQSPRWSTVTSGPDDLLRPAPITTTHQRRRRQLKPVSLGVCLRTEAAYC
jgi:hypothetical protein